MSVESLFMILECPACQKRYLVDQRSLGDEGRTVRCANCKNQWFAMPRHEEIPMGLDDAIDDDRPIPAGSSVPALVRDIAATPLSVKLSAGALLFLTLLTTMVFFRGELVSSMPGIYSLMGIYRTDGVVLADLSYEKQELGLTKDLHLIGGYMVNTSKEERRLPALSIRMLGKEGQLVKKLTVVDKAVLKPGEKKAFNGKEDTSVGSVERVVFELGNPFELKLRKN